MIVLLSAVRIWESHKQGEHLQWIRDRSSARAPCAAPLVQQVASFLSRPLV